VGEATAVHELLTLAMDLAIAHEEREEALVTERDGDVAVAFARVEELENKANETLLEAGRELLAGRSTILET
jgi:hypothetical protein